VEVILRLTVGGMYYNSVSSPEGDTLGTSHVGQWYERRGDEIVMDLSYCISSSGTTVWVLCWSGEGRVAILVSYINGNYKGVRADRQTKKGVLLTVYTNDVPLAMFSGGGTDPKEVIT
jgi:hypothetical protein